MTEETLNKSLQNRIEIFFKKNLKQLIILFCISIFLLFSYFFFKDLQKKKEIKLSEQYTQASIQFSNKKIEDANLVMGNIVSRKHKFYSPLALYFIIDNKLETDSIKIINYFDIILSIKSIDKENLNLIKIKKAIYLFDSKSEEQIIKTLNPVINSDSVWRNTAIQIISDYFISKGQKSKSNEYIKLLNQTIKK